MRFALRAGLCVALAAGVLGAGCSPAFGASAWWHLSSRMVPSHLAPGGEATIVVQAVDLGSAATSGKWDFSDVLPEGVSLQSVRYFSQSFENATIDLGPSGGHAAEELCETSARRVSCSSESKATKTEFLEPLFPFAYLEMQLKVKDEGAVAGENEVQVSGGGAPTLAIKRPVTVSSAPAGFGVEEFSLVPEAPGGEVDTRAGSHPYQLTNTLAFKRDQTGALSAPAPPRDLHFKLPAGLIGNATALAQCSDQDFAHIQTGGAVNGCAGDTAIGVAVVTAAIEAHSEAVFTVPIFNLTPAAGEPARFGFEVLRNPVILDTAVRSGPGEDYGITVNASDITEIANFISATTTFWGAPADPSHDEARGWGCLLGGFYKFGDPSLVCEPSNDPHPVAFLTLPTNCRQPFTPSVEGVSWPVKASSEAPALPLSFPAVSYQLKDSAGDPLGLTGCNQLAFAPLFSALPSAHSASSPSGLDVNLGFDDEGLLSSTGVAQSQLKDTTVVLPEGLSINPSAGVGLGGCTPGDYERETLTSEAGAGCPNDSKLGSVEAQTPLLSHPLHGSLFIAQPFENPFGSLVAIYIVIKDPETGVLVKLPGKVAPDPVTGQLTTVVQNAPQLPISHFNFHFREGQQAPLITPPTCGDYTSLALLSPWAEPAAVLGEGSPFAITSGVAGGPCPAGGAAPFSPQMSASTLTNNAGSFSEFDLRLTRGDGDQEITTFSTALPPGLEGVLAGIPFCPEQDIALARTKTGAGEQAEPSCPAASQLGRSQVGTGVGAVLAYTPGRVYLAGPYDGDPFSLVSVTSAVVGPFDLGTVVIRFGLRIDPHSAQVSVDPTASEPIPHILQGIITHVRDIQVHIDRPRFILNPTSCAPMSISSTLTGNEGATAVVSSPFQAASCASLGFAPRFSVLALGRGSKANGVGLRVRLSYPPGSLGGDANIARVKVALPKQLPSRLTTLQKACRAVVFDADPASCPAGARVGQARVLTPVIPEPLQGPAYFVSHGGEAFPDLTIVLKGYGVTVELVGSTSIRHGITTTTFKATPDVPFNTFELTLPPGSNSALAANGDLCRARLAMPTELTAQNGALIRRSTPIKVTGCKPRRRRLAKALKRCHHDNNKARRTACEHAARKRFPTKTAKQNAKTGNGAKGS